MSLSAMLWVFENSEATLGARLVLLVLADYAHDDGTKAFPEVETIARKTRMSRKGVQLALRRLESDGLIVQTGTRSSGTKVYAILMEEGGVATTPPADEGGVDDDLEGAKMTPGRGVATTPDPPRTLEQDPPLLARVPKRVDRTPVTIEHAELAALVLEEWNRQTGQNLSSADWLSKIVLRIREYPGLGPDDHAHVIAASLASPWWKGPATPSVVYGNGAQFERSIVSAAKPVENGDAPTPLRYGRGMTTRQMLDQIRTGELRAAVERINR